MRVQPRKTSVFREGDDLPAFVKRYIPSLKDGSILAVSSKIVALAEKRTAEPKDKKKIIETESSWRLHVLKDWWLTVRDNVVIVNAGIDDSNANGKLVLLPKDSFAAAQKLRRTLKKHYRVKRLGIVITDSRVAPLRAGVTGVALGYAGFKGVRDYRGTNDIFGREMKVTQTNVADSLATAATLVMGEGSEQCPLAVIEDAPAGFCERVDKREVLIEPARDMYRTLFRKGVPRRIR